MDMVLKPPLSILVYDLNRFVLPFCDGNILGMVTQYSIFLKKILPLFERKGGRKEVNWLPTLLGTFYQKVLIHKIK